MLNAVFPSRPPNCLFPPPHLTMTKIMSPTQLCQRAAFLCGLILLCQLPPTRPIGCRVTNGPFVARPLVCCLLLSPCCHICGRRWCGPILLLLPRSLSAAAPSPLTAVVIVVKLIVRLSVLPMPLCRRHIQHCHHCSPIFAPIPPPTDRCLCVTFLVRTPLSGEVC